MRNLLDHLNPRFPILNAGMGGGLAGAAMVAAINDAGGLGVLGSGALPPHLIQQMIVDTRAHTSRPFGANIILPMSDGSDIEACFDGAVDVLVLFWGDPQPFVADAHKRNMFVIAQCGGADDAVAAADAGVDAVIVQGTEAGGHVKATAPLATSLAETVKVLGSLPVIAAGGLASGSDIESVLGSGASAVSLGTRFLASHESQAVAGYKERLLAAHAADTVLTDVFNLGWPDAKHRVIRNTTYDAWEAAGKPAPGARPGEGDEIGAFNAGSVSITLPRYTVYPPVVGFAGDLDAMPLYAGESVEHVNAVESIAAIMTQLVDELRRAAA